MGGYKDGNEGCGTTGFMQQWTFFLGNDFNNSTLDRKGKKGNKVNGLKISLFPLNFSNYFSS